MRSYLLNNTFPAVAAFKAGGLVSLDGGNKLLDLSRDSGALPFDGSEGYVSASHVWEYRENVARLACLAAGSYGGVFFTTTGSEAIEAAIKFARRFQWVWEGAKPGQNASRNRIYYQTNDFHGRTMAALATTSGPMYYFDGFGPTPKGFHSFHYPQDIDWEVAAAVLLSPVRSPTGDLILPDVYHLKHIRDRCYANGVVLIFDEIQTGAGRCGHWTLGGSESLPVVPDMTVMGKGMARGFPVGAVLVHSEAVASNAVEPGTHYSTFSGNFYTICGVERMLESLGYDFGMDFSNHKPDTAVLKGIRETGLEALKELGKYEFFKNVRGLGMLLAFDVDVDVRRFAAAARRQGVLLPAFRNGPGTIKLYPSLDANIDLLRSVFDSLARAYKEAASQ